MADRGLRNPGLYAAVFGSICLVSIASVIGGILIMQAEGQETTASSLMIGGGIAPAVICAGMTFIYLRARRLLLQVQAGKDEIARWTVTADDVDAFRANDATRTALGAEYINSYTPPDPSPPDGIEVIFTADAVMVGGAYFSLATTGLSTFFGPQMLPSSPLCLEFGIRIADEETSALDEIATLRVPVGRIAVEDAKRVLAHFQRVETREIIVNPDIHRRRLRVSLWVTMACAVMAAIGFGAVEAELDWGYAPLFMTVAGTLGAFFGTSISVIIWLMQERQHGRV